ncbi:MAG: S9 family peptidase, partial [Calditrichaeota bacterium]
MSSRKPKTFLLIISSILVFTLIKAFPGTDKKRPPETPRKEVREVLHGVEIVDPYRWLEDQNSPETRAWIDAQNAYTQSLLSDFPGREKLKKRLTELLKVDVINLPYGRGGRYFFTRRTANQNLAVIYMRHGLHGKDEVLIDPHKLSSDFSRSVQIRDVSQDGNLLVYGIRHGGEDEVILRFYDVEKHQNLPDSLPRARYFSISITPDNQGIFYTRHEKKGPRIYYHKIGSDYKKDRLIFGEGYDFSKIILSRLSNDGHYLLIHVLHGSAGKTDVFVKDLRHNGKMITVIEDVDARTFGYIGGDKLYLETNWQAPNHRVMVLDLESPPQSPDEWREVIPEQPFPIQSFDLAGGKLFVHYLENVVSRLKIYNPDGTLDTEVHLPAMGSVSGIRARWESPEVFFVYSSFHIPTTIYRYEIETKRLEVWAKRNINIDTDNIEVKQVWYHSKDGTRIPMFLVHKKGLQPNGAIPTYLTGYGGFNISRRPGFSANTVLWVELGGLYALPNLRGGGEFGEKWHRAGMLEKKQNVFDDFI